ncbi:hypothetical protein [Clostridium fallax]|uniref:Uncharacterized protein n=1 Tax=Clostridium fallax TaxID=1533 RepID=A0A1M4UYZ1_9CLOT|nr:hypothetical protein [Clostridium fallax]SHE61857.1 hypothetical protein SAMN05443638_10664 [Clostridium fallax]SQB06696.1 Uncharacterised protein [Clostridium fallax]
MNRNMCSRNVKEKYFGIEKCAICGEKFKWVEDENAELIVYTKSYDGNKVFLDFDLIAKCTKCLHKCKYKVSTDGEKYR